MNDQATHMGLPSKRSEPVRFVPSGHTLQTAFIPTNVPRIPERTFPKQAKTPLPIA